MPHRLMRDPEESDVGTNGDPTHGPSSDPKLGPMTKSSTVENGYTAAGSLGLKGLWAAVGNASAVVVIAVVMFLLLDQVKGMHTEGMATLRELFTIERESNKSRNSL